ncbi:aldehyde dehydrogenase family protein [Actinomadura roseirufa]|uniref:aldehyde dehydrogenase family protein n=1 Tax=Actinomadura roseirufa TaxID=2094049 RepID=UPI0010410D84|nr:aldehyde dehydrogenase family protein [Actinomadura roseirufa]
MTPPSSDGALAVENPATGEIVGYAPQSGASDVAAAFDAASAAYPRWRHDEQARRDALERAAALLLGAVDELAPLLTAEQGRPLEQARHEVRRSAQWFEYFARLAVDPVVVQDDETARVAVRRRPLGVVAAITPWNFPLLLAAWKIAPALRAGNTVVIKPSPVTPLSTLRMVELLGRVLPPGVLTPLSGDAEVGGLMVAHPLARKISFTGSTATGKRIAAAAGANLSRLTLELGGNDAAIVLDDCDVPAAAAKIFAASFINAGQVCMSVKRVYVPERAHDEFVGVLADLARRTRVGDGASPETQMGPLTTAAQLERVSELVDGAVAGGATAVTGGRRLPGPGHFYPPTIVTGASDDSGLVAEEQFGPALPVLTYTDVDDAVRRANAGPYGLAGSVWGRDLERARAVAGDLDCGTVWLNAHLPIGPHQPFGGVKDSGLGVENGLPGLESFSDAQTYYEPNTTGTNT